VKEAGVSDASKADRIASATRRTITEKMEEDPTFYKRFSLLLEETIRDYRARRISERDYLKNVIDLAGKVPRKDRGTNVPETPVVHEERRAVAKRNKLDNVGWHTFRHTYRSWLDDAGAPIGVQQKLMRHADISTTAKYGDALMESKRKHNSIVVRRALGNE